MARRPIRLEGDARLVLGIAVVAAIGVVAAGPSPTGSTVIDVLFVGGAAMGVVWAASTAPWWIGVVGCGVAAACAPSWWLVVLGLAGAVLGAVTGARPRRPASAQVSAQVSAPVSSEEPAPVSAQVSAQVPAQVWSAITSAVALQVLARLGHLDRLGLSAAIAIVVAAMMALAGLVRRPRRQRRIVVVTLAGLLGLWVIAVAGLGVAGLGARSSLEDGADAAQLGVDQLVAGDFDLAQASFAQAAVLFGEADDDLGAVWTQPARLVPVVAQHREAAVRLVGAAEEVSVAAATSLDEIDVDAVRVVGGRIDVDAVRALEAPLVRLQDALGRLGGDIDALDSPWLADRLTERLDELASDIERQTVKGDNAIAAVQQAPAMLGAEGPRVYFLAFTTPSEARGLGGFMGNWAEVTITDGDIDVSRFGRHTDLSEGGDVEAKRITGPADFLAQWGQFGFQEPDGGVRDNIWADITISPHFPDVAEVIAQLYPQSGGQELDGVFAMDVFTLAALMQLTGDVDVPGSDLVVTSDNAAEFMLASQYSLIEDKPDRVDALEVVALTTVERLLSGGLPSPPDLADLLSPYVRQGRLMGWSSHPEEQALLTAVRMDGALPALEGRDGFGLVFNNAGNSKIDYFLSGDVTYAVDTSGEQVTSSMTVELRNESPSSGLPDYVIANLLGKPRGTSTLHVSVYSSVPFSSATVDGETVGLDPGFEHGWFVSSAFVDVAPGGTAELVVNFDGVPYRSPGSVDGSVDAEIEEAEEIVVRMPPTAQAFTAEVVVDGVVRGEEITESGTTRR